MHDLRAFGVSAVAVSSSDLEARREPLDIPLERAGKRLVEVVQVEDEIALRGGEAAEVREVGVAAELHLEAARRQAREVVRHHRRGAAEEGEGRDEHAAVPDRQELRDARRGLLLEKRHRVTVSGLEPCMTRPRASGSGLTAALCPLGNAPVNDPRRGGRSVRLGIDQAVCRRHLPILVELVAAVTRAARGV